MRAAVLMTAVALATTTLPACGGDALPPATRDEVKEYVELEAEPARVLRVEHVAETQVGKCTYDVWDVTTDGDRYWVVAWPMDLYERSRYRDVKQVASAHKRLSEQTAALDATVLGKDPPVC